MSSVQMIPLMKISKASIIRKADMMLRRILTVGLIIITTIELPLQMAEEAGHDRSIRESRRRNKSPTSWTRRTIWKMKDRTIERMTGVEEVYSCISQVPGQAVMRLQRVAVSLTRLRNTINVLTTNMGPE